MLKAELIEKNKNLIQQNGELMYLLEFGKLRCEDSEHQMIWERDSNSILLQQRIDKAIEYIRNHQLVFKDATLEEIEEWFNQFYIDVLEIIGEQK